MAAFDHVASNVKKVPAGLSYIVYWAEMNEITTFPSPDPAAVAVSDRVVVDDPFVFAPTACWRKIETTPDKGSLKSEQTGNIDYFSHKNTLTFEVRGSDKYVRALANELLNKPVVFLAPDKCGGDNLILGEHCSPARLESYSISTGNEGGDDRKGTFVFTSVGNIAPTYTATIQLTPTP